MRRGILGFKDRNPRTDREAALDAKFPPHDGWRFTTLADLDSVPTREPRTGDRWGRWVYGARHGKRHPILEHASRESGFWWVDLDEMERGRGGALGLLQHVSYKRWASRGDLGALFEALDDLGYVRPYGGPRKGRT